MAKTSLLLVIVAALLAAVMAFDMERFGVKRPAAAFSKFLVQQQALTAEAMEPGSDIYELCDNPETHTLQASSIDINPSPPTTGQPIVITINGKSKKAATSGQVKVDLRLGFVKYSKTLDLCSTLSSIGSSEGCPLNEGDHQIVVKQDIPANTPALKIQGTVRAFDQDGALMTCVQVHFQFKKP